MTPAARALLRSVGISLDGRDDLPAVIRLADAHALTHTAATATTAPASTATPTPHTAPVAPPGSGPASATGAWASVDVTISGSTPPSRRLARAVTAAAATLAHTPDQPVHTLVRTLTSDGAEDTALLPDARPLSADGVQRLLSTSAAPSGAAAEAAVEIVDGTASGVTRIVSSAVGRVVVGIGAPTPRVVPHIRDDGQQLITFASTVEVWVHGGVLDAAGTAHLSIAVGRALAIGEAA